MSDNVLPFRRRLKQPAAWSDGRVQDACDELVHVWDEVPGRCMCGERFWGTGQGEQPEGIGITYEPWP